MIKFKYILLLWLMTIHNLSYSQENVTTNYLNKYNYSAIKDKFYDYFDNNKIIDAKLVARYYLNRAKAENDKVQIAEGYVLMHFSEDSLASFKYLDSLQIITYDSKESKYPSRTFILRGNLFFKFDDQKKALENYITALKYAKEKKDEKQIAFSEINIAYLKKYIGKHKEAEKILRYYFYNGKFLDEFEHNQIQLSLVDTYIETNKLDSAKVLIKKGLSSSENKYDYLLLSGFYHLKSKSYTKAIYDLLPCEKYFFSANRERDIYYTLLYLGSSYAGLKEKDKAVKNFVKIDSIVQKTNNVFPEIREVYTYLIDYYKNKGDKKKQLYYIENFLKVDQKLDDQVKYISAELPEQYDTPKLLAEKQNLIRELENKKLYSYFTIALLLFILVTLSILFYRAKKTEKKYRKIAQELIQSVNQKNTVPPEQENFNSTKKIIKTLSDDVVQNILIELKKFENKEFFLKQEVTLGSLAKQIKTNSTYLSETINTYKGKNFATYLNDLRIEFALNRLVKDKKFRSYKLSVIAEELGYNNEQAFALAFKKKTGTTLTVYIKEIEKM